MRIAIVALLGGMFGLAVGHLAFAPLDNESVLAEEMVLAEVGAVGTNLLALEHLNAGNPAEAQRALETALALNATVLQEWQQGPGEDHEHTISKTLSRIQSYHADHSLQLGDEAADEHLTSVLSYGK